LLKTQDDERRHIARELHDSAGQTLAALGMNIAHLHEVKNNPVQLAKAIEEADGLVRHLTQELRTTSYLLHPPLLDESGVLSALTWYVQGLKERSGLGIELKSAKDIGRLPQEMELAIFRFVQEALTNVHRHSESKTALILIDREDDKITVEVRDNGKGISPERLSEIQTRGTGVGIRGMRERLLRFNGELSIQSDASGTRVCASLLSKPVAPMQNRVATVEKVQVA
jgi:signal transduction histidine kinase